MKTAVLLCSLTILLGCGFAKTTDSSTATAAAQNQQNIQKDVEAVKIDEDNFDQQIMGIAKMVSLSNQLNEHLKDNEDAQLSKIANEMQKAWASYSTYFKQKKPELNNRMNDNLSGIVNETGKTTPNLATIAKLNTELTKNLEELSKK